jgi:hypothetical protein
MTDAHGPAPCRRVQVRVADPALAGLIGEWLAAADCRLAADDDEQDLLIVDLPFPRQAGERLARLAEEHPATPILVLSSFFPGIDSNGAVARSLGVAGVLPMPVTRGSLLSAVFGILARVE